MRVGIMITDGGPHSSEKWAKETAAQIVDCIVIEPDSLAFDALSDQKVAFEKELAVALEASHLEIEDRELTLLADDGMDRVAQPLEPNKEILDQACADVSKVAKGKLFERHFERPEVKKFVRSTISSHFATVKHIHRSWHVDNNS